MSQFLLPQIKIPLSSSQSGLSFERTSLSPKVLGLRNATRGGFGKMAFNVGEFSKIQWADFKISNMMYKAGWKIKTDVRLSSWSACRYCWVSLGLVYKLVRKVLPDSSFCY